MKALDIALFLIDAKFSWQNAGKHLKHAKQMELSNKEYSLNTFRKTCWW